MVRVTEEYITDEEKLEYAIQRKPTMDLDKGMTKVVQRGAEGLKRSEVKITYEDGQEAKRETVRGGHPAGSNHPGRDERHHHASRAVPDLKRPWWSPPPPIARGSGVTNRTSVGAPLKKGVIAVDPRVIPYYTKLYVRAMDLARHWTPAVPSGNRIDLAMGSKSEALKYGRKI